MLYALVLTAIIQGYYYLCPVDRPVDQTNNDNEHGDDSVRVLYCVKLRFQHFLPSASPCKADSIGLVAA